MTSHARMVAAVTPERMSIANALVLHDGALGDCVLALHVVGALKRAWGDPRITVAARSPIIAWAKRLADRRSAKELISEARSLEQLGAHRWYHPDARLPEESVQFLRGFDWIVSFLGGAGEAVSVRLSALCPGRILAIDHRPTADKPYSQMHITRQWAVQLGKSLSQNQPEPRASARAAQPNAGSGSDSTRTCPLAVEDASSISLTDTDRMDLHGRLARRLGQRAERIAICHPGSGGRRKCCRLEALEELLGMLRSCGWAVCWMIGPDEMERDGPPFVERLESTAPVIFEESVEAAADLAAGADAYIGHDAGMTHVAALAGTGTVAVFGPTDPKVWGPLGRRCTVVPFPEADGPVERWVRATASVVESVSVATHYRT